METVFLVCAVFGTTFLILQLFMSVLGIGGDGGDLDGSGDLGDGGGVDMGDSHGGASPGADGTDLTSADGAGADHAGHHQAQHPQPHVHQGLQGIVKLLTFQTMVAFLAFFGCGGLAGLKSGFSPTSTLMMALAFGMTAFFVLGYTMRFMQQLRGDGTVRPERLTGSLGTVYLVIPGHGEGMGKVTLSAQGRTIEVSAKTSGDTLPTGSRIVVTRLIDRHTVEVAASDAANTHLAPSGTSVH